MTRVLVIDDDELVRETFIVALDRAGFDTTGAANGKQAEQALARTGYDVVVTDLLMPEKDGIETILSIRKTRPEIAIVAVSGGGAMDAIQLLDFARQFGADRVVDKPLNPADLVKLVSEVTPRTDGQ